MGIDDSRGALWLTFPAPQSLPAQEALFLPRYSRLKVRLHRPKGPDGRLGDVLAVRYRSGPRPINVGANRAMVEG